MMTQSTSKAYGLSMPTYSLRWLFLIVLTLFVNVVAFGQTTIASDGLNNASTLFTASGGVYYTGNSAASGTDVPSVSPFAVEGTHSYGISNGTATLTSSSNINTSGYSGVTMALRLASFSIGSTGNGADAPDIVTVEVSPDGGTTYYSTVRVLGNTNATWSYSAGTGNASTAYDGNVTPVDFQPAAGGARTADGYSTITVTGLPATTTLRFRITMLNNAAAERWVVDDFKVTGTLGITSAQSGNWNVGTTWVGGVVPSSTSNVIIASGHTVTVTAAITRDAATTTTVTGTLAAAATYTNNGTTNVNGTFQINSGGYADGSSNLVYGAAGTLVFAHGNGTAYGANNGTYWPSTNGPVNVTLATSSPVSLGFARTVSGTFTTSAALTTTSNLTITGTCQINSTNASFDSSLNFSGTTTLIYNSGGIMVRGNEWGNTSTPTNVTLQANTTLNYPSNWGAITRTIAGVLTINTGSALYMDYGSPATGVGTLTVGGNLVLAGSLSLGNQPGGDIVVGGNWTNTGTFTPNGRAVFFNGTGTQVITNASGETFAYLINNKTAGTLQLANNVTVTASTGSPLQLLNAGTLDLNGKTLTLSNSGGSILVSGGARTILSSVTGGVLAVTGSKSVTSTTGGTLVFGATANPTFSTILLSNGLDFGSNLSTVNSQLQINGGGFVSGNAPIYASTSTLIYNTTSYNVSSEWTGNATTAGVGTPQNVTVLSGTVNMPNADRGLVGNLLLSSGSTLTLNSASGDLYVRGNWTSTGATFTPNNRAVFFSGTAAQTLTGTPTFDWLVLNNSNGLTLAGSIVVNNTVTLTSGRITLGTNNLTASTVAGGSTSNYIVTASTGQLRQNVGLTAVTFPVGNTAYNPITFTNVGTADVYGVRVANTAPAGNLPAKTITRQWITTEATAGGSNLAVVAQYNTGETGASFLTSTDNFIGHYNGSTWTQVAATHAGSNPFTVSSNANLSPANMTTGTQYFAIGRDNGLRSIASRLVITSITPASPGAGYGFSVTVQSQDAYGAVSAVVAATSFVLTTNGNAGLIGGTITGTIAAGTSSITVSGVTLSTPGTGVTITATQTSGDSLTAGTSATFTVLGAATQLAFVGVPSTGNVGVNLTAFTVEARRADSSVDTNYTGSVTISKATGPGLLSGTLTVTAVNGVATFSAAQFDTAGTYTLAAASGSLTGATSTSIVITLAPIPMGVYSFTGTATTSGPASRLLASSVVSNVSFSSFSRTGLTINASSAADDDVFSVQPATGNFGTAINTSLYTEFTVTPATGYYLNLGSITFSIGRTSAGATSYAVRSSLNSYASDIATGTIATTAASKTVTLSGTSTGAVTYRIYFYGGSSTGFVRIDEVTFNGNAICIDPIAYTVTGGGTICSNSTGVSVGLSNSQLGINYQLKRDNINVGTLVAGTGSALSFGNQTVAGAYTVVATNTNGTCNLTLAQNGSATITVDAAPVAGTASANQTICSGTQPSSLTLNGYSGSIQWESSNDNISFSPLSGENSATLSGTSIGVLTSTKYFRAVVSNGVCASVNSSVVTIVVNPTLVASVAIATPSTTICAGTSVTFTATPTNGGSLPTYQWKVNGTDVPGEVLSTFTTSTLVNGDQVTVVMTSNATPCLTNSPATSNTITITVNPTLTASVVISTASTTVCTGSAVTFTATPTNGGTTPTYQWKVNGFDVVGETNATFTTSTLMDADVVTVVMTSNATPCLAGSPALSNALTITVTPSTVASVAIVSTATTICLGTSVTFTATPTNGGTTPSYQWKVNGNNVGTDSPIYTTTALAHNDVVTVVMTSNATPCLVGSPATSNAITITVNALGTATISGTNGPALCPGSDVTFTVTGTADAIVYYNLNGGSTAFTVLTGGSATITVAGATSTQTLNLVSVDNGLCPVTLSETATVTLETTTWNGTAWSNGAPTATVAAVIAGNMTITSNIEACSLTVNNNAAVSVASGYNVTLQNALTVASGSSFTVNSNANLIQVNPAAVNSGAIVVKRTTNPLMRLDYVLWGSPVAGQNLFNFSPLTSVSPSIRFYTYTTAINFYNGVTDYATHTMQTGKGYLIRLPFNHPTAPATWTGSFTGVPNNGTQTVTLANNGAGFRYNAVSNPYPSTLDMAQFYADNSNAIEPTLYFWRKTNSSANPSYCSYNLFTNSYVDNNQAYTENPNGVIQVGQGFFVEAKDSSTSVEFNNTQRIGNNANQMFRTAGVTTQSIERNRIWLNLTGTAGEFSQTMVGYFTGGTLAADVTDAKFFNDGTTALHTKINGEAYSMNGRPVPFDATDIVPLTYKVATAGTFSITIGQKDGLFADTALNQIIYLKDNETNTYHNLNDGAYSFSTQAGTFDSRFELVYQNALSNENPTLDASAFAVVKSNGKVRVQATTNLETVRIYDLHGRLLTQVTHVNAQEVTLPVQVADQVLMVQVLTADQRMGVKKAL